MQNKKLSLLFIVLLLTMPFLALIPMGHAATTYFELDVPTFPTNWTLGNGNGGTIGVVEDYINISSTDGSSYAYCLNDTALATNVYHIQEDFVLPTCTADEYIRIFMFYQTGVIEIGCKYDSVALTYNITESKTNNLFSVEPDTQYTLDVYVNDGTARYYIDGVFQKEQTGMDDTNPSNLEIGDGAGGADLNGYLKVYALIIDDTEEPATPENISLTLTDPPTNGSTINTFEYNFGYIPVLVGGDSFINATLYIDNVDVGSNITVIETGAENYITYTFAANGTYIWDVLLSNSTNSVWSDNGNFTVEVGVYEEPEVTPTPTITPTPEPEGTFEFDLTDFLWIIIWILVIMMGFALLGQVPYNIVLLVGAFIGIFYGLTLYATNRELSLVLIIANVIFFSLGILLESNTKSGGK